MNLIEHYTYNVPFCDTMILEIYKMAVNVLFQMIASLRIKCKLI